MESKSPVLVEVNHLPTPDRPPLFLASPAIPFNEDQTPIYA